MDKKESGTDLQRKLFDDISQHLIGHDLYDVLTVLKVAVSGAIMASSDTIAEAHEYSLEFCDNVVNALNEQWNTENGRKLRAAASQPSGNA